MVRRARQTRPLPTVVVGRGDARSLAEQQLHDGHESVARGDVQRRALLRVGHIDHVSVRQPVEQDERRVLMVL